MDRAALACAGACGGDFRQITQAVEGAKGVIAAVTTVACLSGEALRLPPLGGANTRHSTAAANTDGQHISHGLWNVCDAIQEFQFTGAAVAAEKEVGAFCRLSQTERRYNRQSAIPD